MPDASTMELAAVLQRLEEIEATASRRRLVTGPAIVDDQEWLCQQLRTALADTRRVDDMQRQIDHLRAAGNQLSNIAFNLAQREVALTADQRATLKRCQQDWDTAVHAAMAATPRENTDA